MSAAGFSIGEALGAPFRLTARRPLTVFVWGLMLVVFSLASLAVIAPLLAGFPIGQAASDDPAAFDAMMGPMMQIQAVSGLLNLAQIALSLVIWAAIMRATLADGPGERRFFLRLGMDELWLLLVGLALFVGLYVGMLILVLVGLAAGALLWGDGGADAVLAMVGLVGLGLVGLLFAFARVSLIAPACVMFHRPAFAEGWRLARGQTVRLALLTIAVGLVYMAIYAMLAAGVVAALFASGAFSAVAGAETLGDLLPSPGTIAIVVAVAVGPLAMVTGFLLTLVIAPFASAARQLAIHPPGD